MQNKPVETTFIMIYKLFNKQQHLEIYKILKITSKHTLLLKSWAKIHQALPSRVFY